MDRKNERNGHLFAFITIFIWGTTFISTKILLAVLSPTEILFLRFTIGFFLLLVISPQRLKIREKKQEFYFAAAGLCGVTLYYLLENIALTYTFASNVGVIISIAPFFTAILAHLFLDGEKLKTQFFIGFTITLTGIFLISFNGNRSLQVNPFGDFLAILAAIMWSIYSILTKKISTFHYHTVQSTRRIFFYGLIFMIPALFLFGFQPDIKQLMTPLNLLHILFLGVGASALCFVTWSCAVKTLGAVKTSFYIYMVPVITVVTSVIVLHEAMTAMTCIGILLTLAGLFISEFKHFVIPSKNK